MPQPIRGQLRPAQHWGSRNRSHSRALPGMPSPVDYALGMAITGWFAAVLVPLIFLDYYDWTQRTTIDDFFRYVPFAGAAIIAVDFLVVERMRQLFRTSSRTSHPEVFWLLIVFTAILISSVVMGRVVSVFYSFVLLILCVNFRLFWELPERVRLFTFRVLSAASFAVAVIPLYLYGWPQMRLIGGIHPNAYGAVLIAFSVFSVMGFRRFGWLALVFSFYMATAVSSRYAMVALFMFVVLFLFRNPRLSLPIKAIGVFFGIMVAIALAISNVFTELLALDDAGRGLGSGATGRLEMWFQFLPQLVDAPWFGYGFRLRDAYDSTHNGYLNVLLENGIVVGGLIMFWVMFRSVNSLIRLTNIPPTREEVCVAAGFLAIVSAAFFQPQLINFGDAMGITFLLFIMAPNGRPEPLKASESEPRGRGRFRTPVAHSPPKPVA